MAYQPAGSDADCGSGCGRECGATTNTCKSKATVGERKESERKNAAKRSSAQWGKMKMPLLF